MLSVSTTNKAYSHANTRTATRRDGTIEFDLPMLPPVGMEPSSSIYRTASRRDGTIEFDLPVEAVGKALHAFITFKRAKEKGKIFTVSNSQRVVSGK